MANLMRKTKDALVNIAVGLGLSAEGEKKDIVARIEEHESDGVTAGPRMLGNDVKPTPINKTLKARAKKDVDLIKKAKARSKKAGTTYGDAQ